jgi:starch synthase
MSRAFDIWYQNPDVFAQLRLQGMACDYSWNSSSETYLGVYDHIRVK